MHTIALDAVSLPAPVDQWALPTELKLFADGWNDTIKGRFLLDAVAARSILDAFRAHGVDLPLDFDHGTYAPNTVGIKRDVPGYIRALDYRPGDGLYAVGVRWTDAGVRAIRPGADGALPEYRYFSPAIRFDESSRRITAIEPVALVTWPATRNQPPIVLASVERRATQTDCAEPLHGEGAAPPKETTRMNQPWLTLLGLGPSATEHEVLARTTALARERDEARAALSAVERERDEARARLDHSERAALIAQGRRDKKLTPALEQLFARESTEKLRAFLSAAPVIDALKPGPQPPSEPALVALSSAQLSAVLSKPYERWSNHERVLVREQSPETFRAKRDDALARGAL
ncbi:MAG: phage protease [Polyangiales bacterium]